MSFERHDVFVLLSENQDYEETEVFRFRRTTLDVDGPQSFDDGTFNCNGFPLTFKGKVADDTDIYLTREEVQGLRDFLTNVLDGK